MRFILDTNVLIPLEDSQVALAPSLANVVRLSQEHGHQLIYHPASERDIRRDSNDLRRERTLERLHQYVRLDGIQSCPWNVGVGNVHDIVDNEILYALESDAAHALITEDRGIHEKARARNLVDRVYTIQTAEDLLRRLHDAMHVHLPSIDDVPLHALSDRLDSPFFDSLRSGYAGFNDWFKERARRGRRAWVYWDEGGVLGALCIYARQENERVTDAGSILRGSALKLATFKVAANCRGKKIGELFLKAAFRYATANRLEHIFIHGDQDAQHFLFALLEDFGFEDIGVWGRDRVLAKAHPNQPPESELPPFEYVRKYYPHFKKGSEVRKFIVPIQPAFHRILFSDYESPSDRQMPLFRPSNAAGNAIKLAYLCHAQASALSPGDLVLFYRSSDEKALTSLGVVELYEGLQDPDAIVQRVRRRTVYSMDDIVAMARRPTKVMLFRLVKHFAKPVPQPWLKEESIVQGNIQSIREIKHEKFLRVLDYAA